MSRCIDIESSRAPHGAWSARVDLAVLGVLVRLAVDLRRRREDAAELAEPTVPEAGAVTVAGQVEVVACLRGGVDVDARSRSAVAVQPVEDAGVVVVEGLAVRPDALPGLVAQVVAVVLLVQRPWVVGLVLVVPVEPCPQQAFDVGLDHLIDVVHQIFPHPPPPGMRRAVFVARRAIRYRLSERRTRSGALCRITAGTRYPASWTALSISDAMR